MAAVPLLNNSDPTGSDDGYESEKLSNRLKGRKNLFRKENIGWAILSCCVLALTAGLSAGVAVLVVLGWQSPGETGQSCIQKTSAPSPVTRDLEMTYHWQQFNGTFMEENIYRQAGRPEVDDAWEALGVNYRSVRVPEDVASEVGLSPHQVQINPKYGGGFPANVEGLHQLHCLNLLRQGLYYNIDYYRERGEGAFKNEEHIVQKHISHCLDIIRQQLMCTVDIGVLGQVWYQPESSSSPQAFVDFNTRHVCRNYEAVRQWAEERQLPEDVPDDYLAPPSGKILDHVP